jgi:GNAT superfamily N-acetyltransferase
MAPGDLAALARIEAAADRAPAEGAAKGLAALTPFLLRHEVFVAETERGRPVGFAAAAPLSSLDPGDAGGEGAEGCFWIGALRVDPAGAPAKTPAALLGAVADRARWFFCRALGIAVPREGAYGAGFYRAEGFLAVDPADWTPALRKRFDAQCPAHVLPETRCLMIRWL